MRKSFFAAAVLAVLAVIPLGAVPAAGSTMDPELPRTPAGQVLVVHANLQDSVRPADAGDTTDLENFAARLATKVPAAPDALVLNEILGPGARRLATSLSKATGYRYRVEVAGERSAFQADGSVRESAVILNTDTMTVARPGGFERVQDEDQAHVGAARRDGTLRVPLLAVHPGGDPAPAAATFAALADARFPDPSGVTVIGGDFRAGRCAVPSEDQAVGCAPQAFWADLTGAKAYSDALFDKADAQSRNHSGYVFARGQVLAAGLDTAYDADLPDRASCKPHFDAGRPRSAPGACRGVYYADAPFGWALLGAGQPVQQSVAPSRIVLDHCELAVRQAEVAARIVNNTGDALSRPVTVTAAAPLTATPATTSLDVPAGQGALAIVKITAPRETPPGEHRVTVQVGDQTTELPVTVTQTCVEPKVYASSFHAGFGPERAVDGDIATFWHSEYSPPTPLPQSITLSLGEVKRVGKVDYQPRFDGNLNGTLLDYKVYVSADGQSFTEVTAGTWAGDARLKTATFTPVDARYVRLEGHRALGGSYLSAAEVTVG
ncbi:discoidin domain-containing protein [Nonomuraea turcica]|uniref:discoidin domain-containing protein n=1 Tax=Nonomuraea sp. G32 TaxID=3067274 RepID=UPI00273BC21B|nr:discoidin domain-containing protein [Nonomuraea sp. G32]MDP4508175.1 discoidin domain-containing protein [Nonomuraea sp. G32]